MGASVIQGEIFPNVTITSALIVASTGATTCVYNLLALTNKGGTKVESQNSCESTWCQVGCISQVPHYPRVRDP